MRAVGIIRGLSVCFLFMVSFSVKATIQPGDTLMSDLAKMPDDKKVGYMLSVLESNQDLTLQTSVTYAEEALRWAEKLDNVEDQARVLNFLGNGYYNLANYEQSLNYYQKALRMAMRTGAKTEVAKVMQKIGIVYYNLNDYGKALLYFEQTLKVFQELQFPIREAELYTSIGSIYFQWEEYQKAIDNYDLAYNIYKTLEYLPSVANMCYLKGYALYKLKNYDEAEKYYNEGLKINEQIQNSNGIAKIYDALGQLFIDKKVFGLSLKYYRKAYDIYKETGDKIIIAQCLNNIGNVQKEMSNFKEAAGNFMQSLELADNYDLHLTRMENYKSLYELEYIQNNSKQALAYYQKFVALRDSIFNKDANALKEKFSVDEETLELKKQLVQKDKIFRYTIISSLIILIVMVLIILTQRLKIKQLS